MSDVNPSGLAKLTRMFASARARNEKSLALVDSLLTWAEESQQQVHEGFTAFSDAVAELDGSLDAALPETVGSLEGATAAAQEGDAGCSEGSGKVEAAADGAATTVGTEAEALAQLTTRLGQSFEQVTASLTDAAAADATHASSLSAALSGASSRSEATGQEVASALETAAAALDSAASTLASDGAEALAEAGQSAGSELEGVGGECESEAEGLSSALGETYSTWGGEADAARQSLLEGITTAAGRVVQSLIETADTQLREPCERLQGDAMVAAEDGLGKVLDAAEGWSSRTADFSGSADDIDRGHQAKQRIDAVGE